MFLIAAQIILHRSNCASKINPDLQSQYLSVLYCWPNFPEIKIRSCLYPCTTAVLFIVKPGCLSLKHIQRNRTGKLNTTKSILTLPEKRKRSFHLRCKRNRK